VSANDRWRHVVNTGKVKDYTGLHTHKSYFDSLRKNAEIMCDLNTPEKIDYFMSHYADTLVQAGQECDSRLMRRQNAKWERPSYVLTWHPDCGSTIAKSFEEDSAHGEHPYTKCVSRSLWKKARKAGLQKNVNYEASVKATIAFFDARCTTVLVPKNLTSYFNGRGGQLDGFVQRYENCQVSKILPDGAIGSSSVIFADEDLARRKVWGLALDAIAGLQDPPDVWDWELLESASKDEPILPRSSKKFTVSSNVERITSQEFLTIFNNGQKDLVNYWDPKDPKRRGRVSYRGKTIISSITESNLGMTGYFETDDAEILNDYKSAVNGSKNEIKMHELDKETLEEVLLRITISQDENSFCNRRKF